MIEGYQEVCSDCEPYGLLTHCKSIEEVTRKCSDCEAYELKKHRLTRSDCIKKGTRHICLHNIYVRIKK